MQIRTDTYTYAYSYTSTYAYEHKCGKAVGGNSFGKRIVGKFSMLYPFQPGECTTLCFQWQLT